MRNVYLIAYDVSNAGRLRKTHRLLQGAGDAVQYSVFRCDLSPVEKQRLQSALWEVLNLGEDRVLVIDLGPVEGRGDACIEQWGELLSEGPSRGPAII